MVDVLFDRSVFCLAGANGLGKSTFLAILNYALTGVVPLVQRKFQSAEEYYQLCVEFSRNYFEGRVTEDDREIAEVTLDFSVGHRSYKVSRGMFEPSAIRSLAIYDEGVSQDLTKRRGTQQDLRAQSSE